MPLVETKMVVSKGNSYDHVAMLTIDQACEYIEYAIVAKPRDVVDAPSRFLGLLYYYKPSLIVALNNLVYRMEGEQPPKDTQGADRESKCQRQEGAPGMDQPEAP